GHYELVYPQRHTARERTVAPSRPEGEPAKDGDTVREVPRPRAAMARFTSPSSLSCESTNTDETAAHRGDSCRHPWSPLEQKAGPARQSSLARPRPPFTNCQGNSASNRKALEPLDAIAGTQLPEKRPCGTAYRWAILDC